MSKQLNLSLTKKLPYQPEKFLLHSGVKQIFTELLGFLENYSAFHSAYLYSTTRSGKTHLAVALSDKIIKAGSVVQMISADEFEELARSPLLTDKDLMIVDDAEQYLQDLHPGQSGGFVNSFETLRRNKVNLLFLSSKKIEEYQFDQHVASRLKASAYFELAPPAAEELPELIKLLAQRRGINLNARNIGFLAKRLPREISALEYYFQNLDHLSEVLGEPIKFRLVADAV